MNIPNVPEKFYCDEILRNLLVNIIRVFTYEATAGRVKKPVELFVPVYGSVIVGVRSRIDWMMRDSLAAVLPLNFYI